MNRLPRMTAEISQRLCSPDDGPDTGPDIDQGQGPNRADAPAILTVIVNGEQTPTCARTLADLILAAGYGDARIATAVNGSFVSARTRASLVLAEGDRIEIVAPRQGG